MRRKTISVRIGNLTLSSEQPVMIQSMLNTPTMDVEACVEQSIRIIEAGGQLVRITAPGVKEAEKLKEIHEALRLRGYDTPLSADIHFVPDAAIIAAHYVEKVRINPGNFVDKRAVFKMLSYTEEEYAAELAVLREKFTAFLQICREYNTAVRIGTNHGSLSDRIMSRYGNTPAGMVEATMEYLRVCQATEFENVVISLKSSDCRVMVDAVRLLVVEMERENMHYPLHLGVTEAGEGEDGRIRSAVGIGALLNEGIGDTIRVSLTEAPEAEIPVARALLEICGSPAFDDCRVVQKGVYTRPVVVADLSALSVVDESVSRELGFTVGRLNDPVYGDRLHSDGKAPEVIYTETLGPELTKLPADTVIVVPSEILDMAHIYNRNASPLCCVAEYMKSSMISGNNDTFVRLTEGEDLDETLAERLRKDERAVVVLSFPPEYSLFRNIFRRMKEYAIPNRVLVHLLLPYKDREKISLIAASQLGGLFLDCLPWGIWITAPEIKEVAYALELSRNILQSAGLRRYKAEFISCPGCGRTLFDLQGAVAKVKKAFGHLNTLKIAVMGCVVNGPGEMGDADYGYVGAGNGKVNLYKGRQMVKAAVPEKEAIEALRTLIEGEY
ncbi:MAG: (E)-4-hydroxy-3-methylbut-2-enyl-diphosphate synthase [Odoribacter sp.]